MQLRFALAEAFGDQIFVGPIGTLEIVGNKHKINACERNVRDLEEIEQALDPVYDQVHYCIDNPIEN